MKNSNGLTAALAMGAAALIAGSVNAQVRGNTNSTTNNGATNNGVTVNGNATNTNLGSAGFGSSIYGNGVYGSSFYGGGFYGASYNGGGYDYTSFYTLGGGYGSGYDSFNPYSAFGMGYGNNYNGYPNNANGYPNNNNGYPNGNNGNNNGYYGNNGNYPNTTINNTNGFDGSGGYYDNGTGGLALPDSSAAPARPYRNYPAASASAPRILPRTSDTMEARRVKGDKFYIGWKGENSAVTKITFAMLDLKKHAIMTRTVTQAPGEYTFPITSRMVYYQMVIEYVNGTTSTVTSPL